MSVARHHVEWLSLVETSGPFISMPVLLRVFPQELDGRDPSRAGRLRGAYEDWLDRGTATAAVHYAWVRHVLTDLLEYPPELLAEGQAIPPGLEAKLPQQGETLRPDLVLRHRDPAAKVQLLVSICTPTQDLAKPVPGRTWNATPGTRMMELLHAADLPLGLVTNGEQWMLVYAPRGETTGFASWYADIWMQEPLTLRAFHSLLHLRRFIGVAEPDTLSALYAESSKDQQELTDQLGKQVRQAVEVLVQSFDRIDAESQRTLLVGIEGKELYNAALTVMMRLVFLFSAEERELLPLNDRFYEAHYAASSLRALLRERADQHGEEVLERRHDAWSRLLATFRAVHSGVMHDHLQLPAYGGSLFDPDRYPFLEGRALATRWRATPAKPLPINNRVVLHLLEALQELRVRMPGGGPTEKRRLSFRALDIEQIGHVYEGLLDHTARRASEVVLGLAGKHDPEIPLTKLEELAKAGPVKLIAFLEETTGRSPKALGKALQSAAADEFTLQHACGSDMRLVARVRPFAALLRQDSFEQLVVIQPGSAYVTSGSDRRSTGTHYTPRSLTEPIVRHTLEPLVYIGPAEGIPAAAWKLKSPREILALKVCDMAMGSGAFLVQVCRYLAERLVEAWENAERAHPGQVLITPDGELSAAQPAERLLPSDPGERLAIARRYVADRCLYGVDINPMAVEMAKLSLWLITIQRDRPFTFLDHAFKCGDSLLGVSSVQQIENFSLRSGERQVTFATANLFRYVDEASAKRRTLEDLPSNDHTQIQTKNRLHAEAEAATAKVKAVADCLIAFELRGLDGEAHEEQRTEEAEKLQLLMKRDADASLGSRTPSISQLSTHAREKLQGRIAFHWAVEFPEVFARGGFDAFAGNPPFVGGHLITGTLSTEYRDFIIRHLAESRLGRSDLCAYFFLQISRLLRREGHAGLLATKTISQGDTREVGLDSIVAKGFCIYRAVPSKPWPGTASLEVAHVWMRSGSWEGSCFLDENEVDGITTSLTPRTGVDGLPFRLAANAEKAFQGSKPYGAGFVLTPDEAAMLIRSNPRNREVLFPYLIGHDLNSRSDQSPSRWVINFFDWPKARAEEYSDCWKIIEERVRSERQRKDEDGQYIVRAPMPQLYWHYGEKRPALYRAISRMENVLAIALTSKTLSPVFVTTRQILDQALIVIASDQYGMFSVIASSLHYWWIIRYGTPMKTDARYNVTAGFETYPFPPITASLLKTGKAYYLHRQQLMQSRSEGLTSTYNRFHDLSEQSEDIARLRTLHVEMDEAVAATYGWNDLELGHGFHATKQGERYTLSEPARRTVLDRLLALNHQRYAEEIKAGLHDKKPKKAATGGTQRKGFKKNKTLATTADRQLPAEFRLSATDPMLYSIGLVVALLSEAGGSLSWSTLLDAFVLGTQPNLLVKFAEKSDAALAQEWAERWNEAGKPEMLLPSLSQLSTALAVERTEQGLVFALKDGPRAPATEDVAFDAWIALKVAQLLAPESVPIPLRQEWTAKAEELAVG